MSILPLLGFLSSVVLVLLCLRLGLMAGLLQAGVTLLLVAIAAWLAGTGPEAVVVGMASNWLPALLLAAVLLRTRSLALTLQLSVVAVVVLMLAFFGLVGDATAFWSSALETIAEFWRSAGQAELADSMQQQLLGASEGQLAALAQQMTILAALGLWLVHGVTFILGYGLYRKLSGQTVDCGRFSDLSFGKVLAVTMAAASMASIWPGGVWISSAAVVLFAVFTLQGVAILHWFHREGRIPVAVLVMVYAALPLMNVFWALTLSVAGYLDIWFRFRRPSRTPGAGGA